ncbi:MAG: nitroreductase family protein [Abditibacteriota bacterium]|nr:nitroreductase family protein [Abditibacteriota bacterium]
MDFKELIEIRRSVRGYKAAASKDDVTAVLTMAAQAPSWKNLQPARTYAVVSEEGVAKFARALPSFNRQSSAGAALLVTTFVKEQSGFSAGEPDNDGGDLWGAYDLGLRDAYLVLAASDMGFDTLIMGIRDADEIRNILNIPENEQIMSVIALGKRTAEPIARPRKPLDETVKFF